MGNTLLIQNRLNLFTKVVSNKIRDGFVIVERNEKMPFTILYKEGRKVDHKLYFFVSCATLGLWTIPWLYNSKVTARDKKIMIAIDEDGRVFEENCYMG
jgi:hypothetical protein